MIRRRGGVPGAGTGGSLRALDPAVDVRSARRVRMRPEAQPRVDWPALAALRVLLEVTTASAPGAVVQEGHRLVQEIPATRATRPCTWSFNPRPRAGGDPSTKSTDRSANVFQSTPPCGGRQGCTAIRGPVAVFQSTPPRGGRPESPASLVGRRSSFNPRPRAGGDSSTRDNANRSSSCFNPRPRAGGDTALTAM